MTNRNRDRGMIPSRWAALLSALLLSWAAVSAAAPPEMRGVWMHASQIKTRAEADQCVARIDAACLNAVFLLVWYRGGQAYYHSDLCPMGEGVEPGYDPLAYMIQECHRRKIEVHAWYVNGSCGARRPHFVLNRHPDWAIASGDNSEPWYDLGKPEVRRFQSDLMIEALKKYDVDGLHFDYIRYSGPTVCYCKHCQEEFAARSGLEPVSAERRLSLPAAATINANPVGGPTTAKVLAEFSDGVPAIAMNELGKGKVLLLNWHASRPMLPAAGETVRRVLHQWQIAPKQAFAMDTAPNRERYGRKGTEDAVAAFAQLGCPARITPEDRLEKLPRDALLILASVYLMPDDFAQSLERFVSEGGRLVVIDGPVFAIRNASVQRVLGMKRAARYFNRLEVIRAVGTSDLVPSSDARIDLEQEKLRLAKWAEYRKAGVSELVRDVYRRAKAAKPGAQVTAAVFTPLASAEHVLQDWPGWLREGIIDFVIPMAYTLKNEELAKQLEEWKTVDPRLDRIVPGLSVYQRTAKGTDSRAPELVMAQHQLSLDHGARGNVYFSLANLDQALSAALAGKYYATRTLPYHPPARQGAK